MSTPRVRAGGGLAAVGYVLRKGREAGGIRKLYGRLRSRNACKTCAVGMSGMVNEAGHFPEVCKKSVQAQAGDMAAPIAEDWFRATPIAAMGVARKYCSPIGAAMSPAWACTDFLHTSGKWPASFTMPPCCPPMPSAHVLHALRERSRR